MGLSILLFLPAVVGVTDPFRVLDYYDDLHTVVAAPEQIRLYACDRAGGSGDPRNLTDEAAVRDADCVRVHVPNAEGRITYYRFEPAFPQLAKLLRADEPVKIWYSRAAVRTLFTRLGTLRAVREGEVYHVDIVNTLLHRHRVAAQSALVGAVVLFVVIPALLRRPVRSYLRRYRGRDDL